MRGERYFPQPSPGAGFGAVDDPVFLTVGRLEEAVMSGAKRPGIRIGAEEGRVDLRPALCVEWVGFSGESRPGDQGAQRVDAPRVAHVRSANSNSAAALAPPWLNVFVRS
jgi:hypothetical protein